MSEHNNWRKLFDLARSSPNTAYRLGRRQFGLKNLPHLYYVVPSTNWVIDWVGYYLTSNIRDQFGWPAYVTSTPHLLVDHIIHYGQLGAFLHSLGSARNKHNIIVATIFHGDIDTTPEIARNVNCFIRNIHRPDRIVTACKIMADRLLDWGASPEKVVQIPLGVDRSLFFPPTSQQRLAIRQRLGIPNDAVCIGSFQKDGEGWEDGLNPKLIKGPDIFLKIVERLCRQYKLFILLSAPARGYVKRGLDALAVPYYHQNLSDYRNIASLYHCLDLYLVTSREEGGPQAVLEALASGVPLVSTRVGLAPDVIKHGHNGFLCDVEDVDSLVEHSARLIEQPHLQELFRANGLADIPRYDWSYIADEYYHKLYVPLLSDSIWQ